jgi:hypothetical protein
VLFPVHCGEGRPFDLKVLTLGVRNMRVPVFILEHPMEGMIAGILLLVLLFGSTDRRAAESSISLTPQAQIASSQKM